MKTDFSDIGGGINQDLPTNQIPNNKFTDGNNVRFVDAHVEKIGGHQQVFHTSTSSASISSLMLGSGYHLEFIKYADVNYWVYCDLGHLYATNGTTHALISSATASSSFGATLDMSWNGGSIGSIVVLNSHAQAPKMWTPGLANKTADLSNWPASTYCRVLRPWDRFLIALAVDEGSGFNEQLLRWSHPADPNAVPSSWDYTDPTVRAGRKEFADESGYLVDCLPQANNNIIYKEHSIYRQTFIGGNDVFGFRRISNAAGMLTRRCGVVVEQNTHVVLGDGDVYVHNGGDPRSIITNRWKTWLFSQMGTNWQRSYLAHNKPKNEVWICFPVDADVVPSTALIWNYESNTFYTRDLPDAGYIGLGIVTSGLNDDTFDGGSMGSFDTDTKAFNTVLAENTQQKILISDITNNKLYEVDNNLLFDTSTFIATLEKDILPLEQGSRGNYFDPEAEHQIHAVYPRFTSNSGGNITISIGVREHVDDPTNWIESQTFVLGTDKKVDFRATGHVISIRFQSSAEIDWKLSGYSIEHSRVAYGL